MKRRELSRADKLMLLLDQWADAGGEFYFTSATPWWYCDLLRESLWVDPEQDTTTLTILGSKYVMLLYGRYTDYEPHVIGWHITEEGRAYAKAVSASLSAKKR